MVKFKGPIIAVEDEQLSKRFYEELLGQKLLWDFGACQGFESGLSLQRKSSMTELFQIPQETIQMRTNSCILYFETEDFDGFLKQLKGYALDYIHGAIEYEWGQRSVSFLDPDGHPIDVSETMQAVFRRFAAKGMTPEQVAERTEHPVEYVKKCLN